MMSSSPYGNIPYLAIRLAGKNLESMNEIKSWLAHVFISFLPVVYDDFSLNNFEYEEENEL